MGIVDEFVQGEFDLVVLDGCIFEIEVFGVVGKFELCFCELDFVYVYVDQLWFVGLIVFGNNLGLGWDDVVQGWFVDQCE